MSNERYNLRGVSASKEDAAAIKNVDKGIFLRHSARLFRIFSGRSLTIAISACRRGRRIKSSLAYVYWRETGDPPYGKELQQDALIMNIDDLLCVGAVDIYLCPRPSAGTNGRYRAKGGIGYYQRHGRTPGRSASHGRECHATGVKRLMWAIRQDYHRGQYGDLPDEAIG